MKTDISSIPSSPTPVSAAAANISGAHETTSLTPTTSQPHEERVLFLSTDEIAPGPGPNRDESAYYTPAFEQLVRQIQSTNGNNEPITVVLLKNPIGPTKYHICAGHRRYYACKTLKLPVRAIVKDLGPREALKVRLMENQGHVKLTPLEWGRQNVDAMSEGAFATQVAFAAWYGLDSTGDLSKSIMLASLPQEVINAFGAEQLRYQDAKPINDAVKANKAAVIAAALEITAHGDPVPRDKVLALLKAAASSASKGSQSPDFGSSKNGSAAIKIGGQSVGKIAVSKSATNLTIDQTLDDQQRRELLKLMERFCKKHFRQTGTSANVD